MTVYVAHEFLESFFCMEDFLLCFSFFIRALVCEGDGYSRVEVSQLSHALGDDLVFVWNSKAVSEIEKRDLPTIYHKEILDKFAQHVLPARYFGNVNTQAKTGDGSTIRSLIEQDVTKASSPDVHVFAGDLIPTGYSVDANKSYTVDDKVLFKVYHTGPNSVPYMSAFEVGTSFFNPKSLTENHYLTFGHNTLEYLKNYPFITVKQK